MSKASKRGGRRERQRRALEQRTKQEPHVRDVVSESKKTVQKLSLDNKSSAAQTLAANLRFIRRFLPQLVAMVLGIATLTGLNSLWPHVRVDAPVDLADPLQPYGVPFSIRNSGNFPIYDVEVQCVPHALQAKINRTMATAPGPAIGNRRFVAEVIPSGESRPFTCDVFNMPPESILTTLYADVGVLVRFRPVRFVPVNWPAKAQVFITAQESGRLQWREYIAPLEQVPPKYPAR